MKNGWVWLVIVGVAVPALGEGERISANCVPSGRHLVVSASGPRGEQLAVQLTDYASLRANAALSWTVEPGSSSRVELADELGFVWAPKAGSRPESGCRVELKRTVRSMDIDVDCAALRSKDESIPGFLNVPTWRLTCPL